jgi:hypothetical protein
VIAAVAGDRARAPRRVRLRIDRSTSWAGGPAPLLYSSAARHEPSACGPRGELSPFFVAAVSDRSHDETAHWAQGRRAPALV